MNSRIKQVRQHPKINMSQEAFGARLGLTGSGISLLESGRRNPSEQVILSICREYGVNETWLRTGEGEMFVETAEDALWEIARSRGLSRAQYALMEEVINSPPEDLDAIIRFMRRMAARLDQVSTAGAPENRPRYPQGMTAEEIHAELDRQLAEEKERTEKPSGSGYGNSGTATG